MSQPVFVAGRGLASALGADLTRAVHALRGGGVAPIDFQTAPGETTPYFAMPASDEDWSTRARRLVRAAAAESGALDARDGTLFVASTSFDMGRREHGDAFELDIQEFSERLGEWLDWQGPILTVCTACTSAVNALLSAAALVRHGDANDALVIGLELSNQYTVGGFRSMQLLSPTAALPFGSARNGLVLGEAVAALHLSNRPARWRLCGGANVVDASDPAGAVSGAVATMCQQALQRSGVSAQQIGLVKLQAAGSPHNDATELAGLRLAFDELPALVSLKGWLGHTLGAAGAAEIALLLACIEADVWPAPPYPIDPALHAGLAVHAPAHLRHVLAGILGFGGGHAAVVLEDTASRTEAAA
jgi:3-oxoacyl-[acyl-carrier-protein] synthase I